MATITAQSLIDLGQKLIQDETAVRWPEAELMSWLNAGHKEIALLKPEVSMATAAALLTAGKTKQTLPEAAISLTDCTRNLGADGVTEGDVIRVVEREILDANLPGWHSAANTIGKILHFVFDPRNPRNYYVYPKAPAGAWYIELIYPTAPRLCAAGAVAFTDTGDTVTMAGHGLIDTTPVVFSVITTTTGIVINTTYYVRDATADTFKVAATLGGTALTLTTNGTGTISSVIGIDDIYANALIDYMLYRAKSKDSESGDIATAERYYAAFARSIGIKTSNEVLRDPNTFSAKAGNPNARPVA